MKQTMIFVAYFRLWLAMFSTTKPLRRYYTNTSEGVTPDLVYKAQSNVEFEFSM